MRCPKVILGQVIFDNSECIGEIDFSREATDAQRATADHRPASAASTSTIAFWAGTLHGADAWARTLAINGLAKSQEVVLLAIGNEGHFATVKRFDFVDHDDQNVSYRLTCAVVDNKAANAGVGALRASNVLEKLARLIGRAAAQSLLAGQTKSDAEDEQ